MIRIYQTCLSVFLSACLGAVLMTAPGCGKKGPPVPPQKEGASLAAPANLAYTLSGRDVTLSWTWTAPSQDSAAPSPEGFEVFVATKPLGGCEGCPFMFQSAEVVPMPKTTFVYTLDQDLNYYFRVQALGPDKIKSNVSETVHIDFP